MKSFLRRYRLWLRHQSMDYAVNRSELVTSAKRAYWSMVVRREAAKLDEGWRARQMVMDRDLRRIKNLMEYLDGER